MIVSLDSAPILDQFFGRFTSNSKPVLLSDYDGTLAPFRVNRFEAVPFPGVREVLNSIQAREKAKLVILTGRPAGEIAPLLALDKPAEVWGLHGFERLYPDGRRQLEQLSASVLKKLDELHAALQRDSFGGLFEAKPNAAVMHWRGLPAAEASIVAQRTRALFEPLLVGEAFRLMPFECGLELRAGRNKGDAVRMLLDQCGDGTRCAAYLGDDLTDEAAFRAIDGRGLGILVRPEYRQTAADIWLKPPEELLAFLRRWRDTLRSRF